MVGCREPALNSCAGGGMEKYRKQLADKPSCSLTLQWDEAESRNRTTRYAGADGFDYELVEGEGWYMIVSRLEDPMYNGPHICPRCNSQSEWKWVNALRMISVQCQGNCGQYTMSHEQLSKYKEPRNFALNRKTVLAPV
jgi:hypothetical protein